jgi:hypothetical protein
LLRINIINVKPCGELLEQLVLLAGLPKKIVGSGLSSLLLNLLTRDLEGGLKMYSVQGYPHAKPRILFEP